MPVTEIRLERFSVVGSGPIEKILASLDATIGHPDIDAFRHALAIAATDAELRRVVADASGSSDLIEFYRFDAGAIIRKERGGDEPRMIRLLIGNPIIMKDMAKPVPDAASYAPITLLIDERSDGVHVSYDLMASVIAPYNCPWVLEVARKLDDKIKALLEHCVREASLRTSGANCLER